MTNDEIVKKYLEFGLDECSNICGKIGVQKMDLLYALAKAIEKYNLDIAREKVTQNLVNQQQPKAYDDSNDELS